MSSTANPGELDRFAVRILSQKDDHNLDENTHVLVELVMRYAFYVALVAIFLMIIALILKLMWNFDGDEGTRARPRPIDETTRLLFSSTLKGNVTDQKMVVTLYGTNEEEKEGDLESGSEDWYDGKICVICYDDPRNCFFIPCGHCVSCINCAHRIANEEIKSCPICRGIIDRVRKLQVL